MAAAETNPGMAPVFSDHTLVCHNDNQWHFIHIDSSLSDTLGYSPAELSQAADGCALNLFPETDRASLHREVSSRLEHGAPCCFECLLTHRDGRTLRMIAFACPDQTSDTLYLLFHEFAPYKSLLLADRQKLRRLARLLTSSGLTVLEYLPGTDKLVFYDADLQVERMIPDYLRNFDTISLIHPDDRSAAKEFFLNHASGPLEIRLVAADGSVSRKILDGSLLAGEDIPQDIFVCSLKDVTAEKEREALLVAQARRDSLTKLYNPSAGRELINEYLLSKTPYASCGMMVIDIDYFKNVNDTYGHLFGDTVLITFARMLESLCRKDDIVMRAGGDEFVILLRDIGHTALINRAMKLVKSAQELQFSNNGYVPTCSVGVCYLPKNTFGYMYDQLFENADWALYRAKNKGRNRYEFCDTLQRFESCSNCHSQEPVSTDGIDARYLRNDIVATAFEVFEKMPSFDSAIELLFKIIGVRFQLDRITLFQADVSSNVSSRQYQWTADGVPAIPGMISGFSKEDFLTIFNSYDEYGTTVIQTEHTDIYSQDMCDMLKRNGIRSSVCSSMYCEGKYTGAMVYSVCSGNRTWSAQSRSQLGELTKIISAHLAKTQAINASTQGMLSLPDYDSLTGLLTFTRFREEVERLIVGGLASSHVIIYSDFENFKYFNQKYGYIMGDHLLKEYASFIIGSLRDKTDIFFTRVVGDQFILFMPLECGSDTAEKVHNTNEAFVQLISKRFPKMRLRLRSGIYAIEADCPSASDAIDAANYARKQVGPSDACSARMYDHTLDSLQTLEGELMSGLDDALLKKQFKVYLQPKFSLTDFSVIGAEALVRWQRDDGTLLYPDSFIPLYEKNGRIEELDFYVFEQVAAFLAKNEALGRRQIPISINASILHAANEQTVHRYLEILERYHVDPTLTEIELTETATVSDYTNVTRLFRSLQEANMHTSLDDFGAGYSVLNAVIDIPVNTVKIDRAFIMHCQANPKGIYFLKQIVQLVKGLGYQVLCEGVETDEQIEMLREAGCEEAQGYWFARPVPMEEYEKIVYEAETEEPRTDAEPGTSGQTTD